MPLGDNTAAERATSGAGTPTASGRQEIIAAGTQGAPAEGGNVTKKGAAELGETPKKRDGAAKKAKVTSLIPREEMYAILYVGGNTGNANAEAFSTENFLLQQVQMQSAERYQIVETFQKALIYFMGKAPEIYQYSGALINADGALGAPNARWRDEFISNWETRLRGTVCAENQTRIFIDYNGLLVSGYLLSHSLSENSEDPNKVNFTFALYVTNVKVFGG